MPFYWKNGKRFELPITGDRGKVNAIMAAGEDVYIVGDMSPDASIPIVWKNGERIELPKAPAEKTTYASATGNLYSTVKRPNSKTRPGFGIGFGGNGQNSAFPRITASSNSQATPVSAADFAVMYAELPFVIYCSVSGRREFTL
jgi:hypothetical protein